MNAGTELSEVLHSVRLGGQQVFGWVFLLFGFFFRRWSVINLTKAVSALGTSYGFSSGEVV